MKQSDNTKKKNPSVSWIFFGYCSVLVLIMLVVVWVLRLAFVDDTYKRIRTVIAEESTTELVKVLDSGGNFDKLAREIVGNTDTSIILLDGKGVQVGKYDGDYNVYPLSSDELLELRDLASQSNKGIFSREVETDTKNNKVLIYARNVTINNDVIGLEHANEGTGTIVLSCRIVPMTPTLKTINYELLIITFVMLVFGAVSALLLARHVSRPIVEINEKSSKLAKGDYNVHFNEEGYKEVSELAETLNYATLELGKADRMKRDLIANVSHDLRTPLTMIRGYVEMMRDMPNENNAENMDVIIKETDYLTKLVKDMLDMSKLEANQVEFNIVELDIGDLLVEIAARYNALYKQQEYVFEYEPLDRPIIVKTDKVMLTTVIYNLINNAVNHIGEDKKVSIVTRLDGDRFEVHIVDHGEGIEQSKLGTIWDRYYKAERNLKRENAGTGLGLSIVKTILTKLDCTYGVESTFGEGSDFYFSIAVVDKDVDKTDDTPLE